MLASFNLGITLLLCSVSSFFVTVLFIKGLIFVFKKSNRFQPIRNDGPETHLKKCKTPTMGGLAFIGAFLLNVILFCNLKVPYVWVIFLVTVFFAAIGLLDDVLKVFFKSSFGLRGSIKLIIEFIAAGIIILLLAYIDPRFLSSYIYMPLFNFSLDLKQLAFPMYIVALVGSSNATNITDGLDGLLTIPVINITLYFLVLLLCSLIFGCTYLVSSIGPEAYTNLMLVLVSLCACMVGFFCFNKHPAKIFMGDVGSLSLGAILFTISYILKIELFYAIMALLFIVELGSTALQVFWYRLFQRRVFKMAPVHHHFEQLGWSESKVVHSFWLFSFVVSTLGLLLIFLKK